MSSSEKKTTFPLDFITSQEEIQLDIISHSSARGTENYLNTAQCAALQYTMWPRRVSQKKQGAEQSQIIQADSFKKPEASRVQRVCLNMYNWKTGTMTSLQYTTLHGAPSTFSPGADVVFRALCELKDGLIHLSSSRVFTLCAAGDRTHAQIYDRLTVTTPPPPHLLHRRLICKVNTVTSTAIQIYLHLG